jgi:hypothetical protein
MVPPVLDEPFAESFTASMTLGPDGDGGRAESQPWDWRLAEPYRGVRADAVPATLTARWNERDSGCSA